MDPKTTTPFKTPEALDENAGTPEDIFRAALNILEDFNLEKVWLEETQRAAFNIVEDFSAEKARHEETQRATLNILEDFNSEKAALEDAQRATLNILEDFEAEKAKVEAINQTLGVEIAERQQAEERIKKLNEALEGHTAQLASANKELEAFSYSVSHDLRAPLRGIDGWSLALLEDYHDHLDEQGRQYLDRVRSETQRMGRLIDGMLQLSRVTRAEMRQEPVNLSAIAQALAARLQEAEPGRQVEFIIQAGLSARGDARLLEAALSNLLGNAFKFTSQRAQARIEFGQTETHGQRAFFVRDNGAGFDMAYAQKLFGVFQRLHKASEFPGTGIGLATAQRVIHRHGGRVWAEAGVNQGATFYFTLEEPA